MPIFLILLVLLGVLALVVVAIPLAMIQRYRIAASRRKARGWLATINVVAFSISGAILVVMSALTSLWEPRALPYVAAGLASGGLLGWFALRLGRWEESPDGLFVTPPRWLVLGILLVVTARIGYGFWRAWATLSAGAGDDSWLAEAGVAGSLAAGAVVLGYFLAFWVGVKRRLGRYRRRQGAEAVRE